VDGYADGVYRVETMSVLEPLPDNLHRWPPPDLPVTASSPEVVNQVDAVLIGDRWRMDPPLAAALNDRMTIAVAYGGRFNVYVRRGYR
jgi:hypothetical protein